MSTAKRPSRVPPRARKATGVFAVELAIVVLVFFTIIFGVVELARLMYVFNTLQEVTRRAARAEPADDSIVSQEHFRGAARSTPSGKTLSRSCILVDVAGSFRPLAKR